MSAYLDTRDLEEEIDELQAQAEEDEGLSEDERQLSEDDTERLAALLTLREEFRTTETQWKDGITLIPESEWEDYARQEAFDVGFVEQGSAIENYVDWEKWANDLSSDYSQVEFDGETYYYRNY